MNNNLIITALIFLIALGTINAQDLDKYMQEVREGSFKPIPEDILSTKDQVGLFASIQPYLADSPVPAMLCMVVW